MSIKDKNILIGITGGIAAYKICELIRLFKKNGANVKVVVTKSALEFVTKLTLETLSQEPVYVEQFSNEDKKPEHIALCDWADVFLIAPASANTIGKIANGICDNLLTSLACAYKKQMIFAPAMNTGMWDNKAVQKNIETLKSYGVKFVEPEEGYLACGVNGQGRLADINRIYDFVCLDFEKTQFLEGKRFVITAGGTKENIDPVRYVGNYSSGKMGKAIADKAKEFGADVVLISTVDFQNTPYPVLKVTSALEMFDVVKREFCNADVLVMTAAVADYRPEAIADLKIKKESNDELTIKLVKNPDILAEMCKIKKQTQAIVGFCAESNNLIDYAKNKIQRKGCDYLVANDISKTDIGFSSDFNEVFVIDKSLNVAKIEKNTKENIAQNLLELLWQKQVK